MIAQALREVRERIAAAAHRAGRDPRSVRLIAVSKTKDAQAVRQAYEAGQRDFGENYVQELCAKARALADLSDLRWHLIGHLQTNKAKQVIEVVSMVQTIDSERVARELSNRVVARGTRALAVLIEVNVGGEDQKSGASVSEARGLVATVQGCAGLELRGLMTVPPFDLDAAETKVHFDRLRALRDELGGEAVLPELSMGMSHDFEEAIGSGATMVRVGTMIFGGR